MQTVAPTHEFRDVVEIVKHTLAKDSITLTFEEELSLVDLWCMSGPVDLRLAERRRVVSERGARGDDWPEIATQLRVQELDLEEHQALFEAWLVETFPEEQAA